MTIAASYYLYHSQYSIIYSFILNTEQQQLHIKAKLTKQLDATKKRIEFRRE